MFIHVIMWVVLKYNFLCIFLLIIYDEIINGFLCYFVGDDRFGFTSDGHTNTTQRES